MNYHKVLLDNQISEDDIQNVVALFSERAKTQDSANRLPDAIYESAAIDIAMGAIDLSQETQEAMQEGHSARHWLHILTGQTL